MEYRSIFKCRLCGENYEAGCIRGKRAAIQAISDACLGKMSLIMNAPLLTGVHICKNGDLGVADFQGFRTMEEK